MWGGGPGVPSSSEMGFSSPPPLSSLGNPCWVTGDTVLGPLRTTLLHPLEDWPRRVDSKTARLSWCCAQAAAGARMGGGEEEENEEEEGWGGWGSKQRLVAGWAVPSPWGRVLRMPEWVLSWALERLGRRCKMEATPTIHWVLETVPSLGCPSPPPAV